MARYVKVSVISCLPCRADLSLPDECLLEKVTAHLESAIRPVLPDQPDLIVLPECCDRPAELPRERQRAYYAARGSRVLERLQALAARQRCYLAYSAIRIMPDGTLRNATQLIDRQGKIAGVYHKNHLVLEENTALGCLYGKDAPVIQCDFGRVACLICFDLNFDELRLKYAAAKPELLVFCSNYHGGLMQNYWAYSCRAYFVGAIGSLNFPAVGTVISPLGELLASTTNYFNYRTVRINLDYCVAHLDYNWEKLERMKERYGAGVEITSPPYLGSVLISSTLPEKSARQMAQEFEIELLDDYFKRALAHRHAPGHIEP